MAQGDETTSKVPRRAWHAVTPVVAIVCLLLAWGRSLPLALLVVVAVVLVVVVLSAVHHAEVVAARVGEPFGSLVLAVAVTVIEVALIITLMSADPAGTTGLARDTVFAALMITCNGIVGLALLARTARGRQATFNAAGAVSGLSAIALLATFSLVLPSFTRSTVGPTLSDTQLGFAAVAALVVYLLFVFVQTVRHRDYFLPEDDDPDVDDVVDEGEDDHAGRPSSRTALVSLLLLLVALVAVVGLAKVTTPLIEATVESAGLPTAAVAVSIALLVLLPESIAAVRAARRGRVQTSLNLAYGSAMASIGLTIPTVAVLSWVLGYQLVLGLEATSIVLLAITMFTGLATVLSGRATVLQGGVHISLLAGFLVLVVSP